VPKIQFVGGVKVRLWSDDELRMAKKYKAEHYWGKGSQRKGKRQKGSK
jgi:hypothetical protein